MSETRREAGRELTPVVSIAPPQAYREPVSMEQMWRMATAIAKSGLFGIKGDMQAFALMLIADAEGKHPALVARDYDVINGRPAKRSEAMLRDFQAAGGKVRWIELTAERAEAEFSHPMGGTVAIHWDLDMAREAGLASKDGWKKYPRSMLRARVLSEGIRTVFPGATSGMYLVEEAGDMPPADRPEPRGEVRPAARPSAPAKPVAPQRAPGRRETASRAAIDHPGDEMTDDDAGEDPPVFEVVDEHGEVHHHRGAAGASEAAKQVAWLMAPERGLNEATRAGLRDGNVDLIRALNDAGYLAEAAVADAALFPVPAAMDIARAEPSGFVVFPADNKGRTKSPERALETLRTVLAGCTTAEEVEHVLQERGAVGLARQFADAGLADMADAAQCLVYEARERVRAAAEPDPDDAMIPF